MKKLILKKVVLGVCVTAIVVGMAFITNLILKNDAQTDITLANIEALSQIECYSDEDSNCTSWCIWRHCGMCWVGDYIMTLSYCYI